MECNNSLHPRIASSSSSASSCSATVDHSQTPILSSNGVVPAKRKRGRPPNRMVKEEEDVWEDVCFLCFDGGSLVLCDHKRCPKAYHPECIKRDEAYFQSKGKWYCGWHICTVCQIASHYMCYTCTYSLCKGCTKEADFVCVRGNMGFCRTCMKTIMLIENKDLANKELVHVDFDDKTSWEYLFKVYWIYLKHSIRLTLRELTQAKNPSTGVSYLASNQKLFDLRSGANFGNGLTANGHCEQLNLQYQKDLKQSPSSWKIAANDASLIRCKEWASKELLEFVAHVKNGDASVLSQFDVQGLLLEYIKKNGLMDTDCQVICDLRLTNLFGKARVSQREMLKLLECHFLMKEDLPYSSTPAETGGTTLSHLKFKENKESSDKLQNSCKKFEVGVPQNNLDEYAAIDVHNMNLIYLPRNLMASLTRDEKFYEKVIGSIVRIRISNSDQKHEMYRLVQVTGTNKVPEPYKVGDKMVDVTLQVLNLDNIETIAIDAISDQEFCPDECRHLREIIKCGLVKLLTVGEVLKKAMELLSVRLDARVDAEILKLSQLCDQTSDKERIKELRLRIAKLQLLKTPEECQRRFSGILQVHADPKMSPRYDSEQVPKGGDNQKPEVCIRSKSSDFSRSDCRNNNSQREVQDEGLINSQHKVDQKTNANLLSDRAVSRLGTDNSAAVRETQSSSPMNESETEKLWFYRDPNDKIQGPFSIEQLREWSTTGYFPPDMRIWTIYEYKDSILLTHALNGRFHTAAHLLYNLSLQSHQIRGSNQISDAGNSENKDKLSRDDNQIVGSLKGDTRVQFTENNESGGSDIFGGNSGVQSSGNHESGRTDVFNGTTGMQSRENSEYGKINVVGDNGVQYRANNESGRTDTSVPKSCGFTESCLSSKETQPGNSPHCELNEHNSSSDYCQVRQLPSLTSSSSHVPSLQGGGRGNEGYRFSPKHENHALDGSAATWNVGHKSNESQCLGHNQRSFPINLNSKDIDLNSGPSPATNSDSSKQSCDMELTYLPSRVPKEGNRRLKTEAAENSQLSLDDPCSRMPDSPSPMLKLSNRSQVVQVAEYKPPRSFKVEYQDVRPSQSNASTLVVGGAQFQSLADDRAEYPPPPVKPVSEGWSSGLVPSSSLKQHEVATVTANVDPTAHISACNPTPDTSSWHDIVEPIEFISLAEEAVSDLLAEVDAMESRSGDFASPTSAMRCEDEMMRFCKNECFTIDDLSPTHNSAKSDALSSTGNIELPCRSTTTQEPVGASEGKSYDPLKRSSRNLSNSRDREARSKNVRVNQREAAQPGLSLTMSEDMNSAVAPTTRMEVMDSGIMGRATEPMNLFWGAPPEEIKNIGWATSQGTSWGHPNLNRGAHHANGGLQWDGQQKYAGDRHPMPTDYATHGVDLGYGRGRPSLYRQPFGGGGGYAWSPRVQRVCKFYENGHCRKGASCDYLHP